MPQRFLRPGITTSESWNRCSYEAQSFFIRLMTIVDDYGRYDGRSSILWGSCFALRPDMSPSKVADLKSELALNNMIICYVVDEKEYVQMTKWKERARGASKYPAPDGMDATSQAIGKIYFIQGSETKRIKIGFTEWTVEERLNRLQTGSSERLTVLHSFEGTLREERAIHRLFSHLNCGGEWFQNSAEITQFAANKNKCAQPAGSPQQKTLPSPSPSPSPSPPPSPSPSPPPLSPPLPPATPEPESGGTGAVELPHGFPNTLDEARIAAEFVGCPTDVADKAWNKAMSRGGRDAKDIPIRNWRAHLAAEWAYEQARRAESGQRVKAPRLAGVPKLSDVAAYAKMKWDDDPRHANWAVSFYSFWADQKRNWQRHGKVIDWQVELSAQVSKWRTEKP